MKIGAIIFSRVSSRRLPNKAFISVSGKFLLKRVVERLKYVKNIDHICIATSENKEDDKIEKFAKSNNIEFFRGSLNDVSKRALEAANHFQYDNFLRVCGDRPFLDPIIYDKLIEIHKLNANDLTTNIFPRMVPAGLTGEVINVDALKKSIIKSNDPIDREHVTRFFYHNPNLFSIINVNSINDKESTKLRLVIDDKTDLERARWIVKMLKQYGYNEFSTNKIISLAKKWEEQKIIKNKI